MRLIKYKHIIQTNQSISYYVLRLPFRQGFRWCGVHIRQRCRGRWHQRRQCCGWAWSFRTRVWEVRTRKPCPCNLVPELKLPNPVNQASSRAFVLLVKQVILLLQILIIIKWVQIIYCYYKKYILRRCWSNLNISLVVEWINGRYRYSRRLIFIIYRVRINIYVPFRWIINSLVWAPYTSAVSRKVTPAWTAWWMRRRKRKC